MHQRRSEKINQGEPARGQRVPFSGLVQAHSPAESRAFAPVAAEGTGERDSPPEGAGVELSVPLQETVVEFASVVDVVRCAAELCVGRRRHKAADLSREQAGEFDRRPVLTLRPDDLQAHR